MGDQELAALTAKMPEIVKVIKELPEVLQPRAFEALLDAYQSGGGDGGGGALERGRRKPAPPRPRSSRRGGNGREDLEQGVTDPNEFYAKLAEESGANEDDLRDVIHLDGNGRVEILKPARSLGKNKAEQTRSVVALVAGARAFGLGESPVDGETVRNAVKTKNCFDKPNYSKVFRTMRGFNQSRNGQSVLPSSRWTDDFAGALNRALGRATEE